MSDKKRRDAQYLFDELGSIDEKMIAEAQCYRAAPKRRTRLLAVAALAAVILVMISLPYLRSGNGNNHAPDNTQSPADTVPETLAQTLESCRESGIYTTTRSVDLFDGTPRLIWQYTDSGEYCTAALTAAELTRLISSLMTGGTAVEYDENGGRSDVMVWISNGDSTLISPCLKPSPGNVGYGVIFDYSPEIEPSSGFAKCVYELIDKGT